MNSKKFELFLFLAFSLILISSKRLHLEDDCLNIDNLLCGSGGKTQSTTYNLEKGLIGWWSFDDKFAHDKSGNGLNGYPVPEAGPSYFVKGNSAFFSGSNTMIVQNNRKLNSTNEMTIMFWVYLLEDSTGNWRSLLHKGNTIQELTPTIMLWPKERRLHVRVGTEIFWNEGIESKAVLNMKQWIHIAVILSGQTMQLYINGLLDNQAILKGKIRTNDGPLYVGKDPWHPGVKCFLDELKIYNTPLRDNEIQSSASLSNILSTPTYATLGCQSCTFLQAMSSCGDSYHLCSYSELYSGGYMLARRNGWFKYNTDVWARESQTELEKMSRKREIELGNPKILKMALCCSDA